MDDEATKESGNPEDESGPRELIQASIDAVRQWTYEPTSLNGKPCYVLTRIDVNFEISSRL